jgi:sulfide dehydrogenase cytochrome subunit
MRALNETAVARGTNGMNLLGWAGQMLFPSAGVYRRKAHELQRIGDARCPAKNIPLPSMATLFALAFVLQGSGHALAQTPTDSPAKSWATACMACHGTNGKAQGVGLPIGGRAERYLFEALQGFKSGQRPGTIMPQIAKAFSEPELKALALEFSKFN